MQWKDGAVLGKRRKGGVCVRTRTLPGTHACAYLCLGAAVHLSVVYVFVSECVYVDPSLYTGGCVCMCGHLQNQRRSQVHSGEERTGCRGTSRPGLQAPAVWLRGRLLAPSGRASRGRHEGSPEGHVCILSWGSVPKQSRTSGTLSGHGVLMCPHHQKPGPRDPSGSQMPEA